MRVVFFGTPEFAVPSLRALLRERVEIAGVVTQPDRPRGRSRSALLPPPVKAVAEDEGLLVLQPEKPVGDLFLRSLEHLRPELGIVVAYGHLLRPEVLALPTRGMINVHASLLPRWRGAAPIQWAIHHGDRTTGVSIMQMEAGLDSGPVYRRAETPIGPEESAGSLADRLADLGAATLLEVLTEFRAGTARARPQEPALATHAPKLSREIARLRWDLDAEQVARAIRAFDPAPGAWSELEGAEVKLFAARALRLAGPPGQVLEAGDNLVVAAGQGAVEIREVQPAGKKRLSAADWAHGRGVQVGQRFT